MTTFPPHLKSLIEQFPADIQNKIIAGWSQSRSIISFRVNHLKSSTEEVTEALRSASLPYQTHTFSQSPGTMCQPLAEGGKDADVFSLPIDQEYTLRGLDIYREGKIYVQSLASMMPAFCLDLQSGQKILDMAAAPGSKTTQIASILQGKCEITALEKFGVRYEKLLHTHKLQGAEHCVNVVKGDATETEKLQNGNSEKQLFDRILLDAPCSSDGRIHLADERTYRWYSETKSKAKAELQLQMLESASELLSPTGKIVYSTCSLSRGENEKVIRAFLRKNPTFETIALPFSGDFTLAEYPEIHCGRWLPTETMEGFFICCLHKIA